ncbi:hypothetical protein [Flavobacterium sp.]|uniref:hypothetical protein n=1 Tax=Flavobacterium sp. TaxID=239 RepID=UPI003F69DEF5
MSTDYCLVCTECEERTKDSYSGIKYIEDYYRPEDERVYIHEEGVEENIFYVKETELLTEFLIKHMRCEVYIIDMDLMSEEIYNYNRFSPEKIHYTIELEDIVLEEYKNKVENRYNKIANEILDLEKTIELQYVKKCNLLDEKYIIKGLNDKLRELTFNIYMDTLSGGFSVMKVWTDYEHEENVKLKSELIRLYKKSYLHTVIQEDKKNEL